MADVLDAKGPANLAMRLFVYRDTHLPVMVTWQGGPQPGPGRGPGQGQARRTRRRRPAPAAGPDPGRGAGPAPGQPAARRGRTGSRRPDQRRTGAGQPGRGPAAAPPPENRLYFADYRDVDGLKWPFRLRRAIGPDTIEETTFDRFRINTKIDPKKIRGPKSEDARSSSCCVQCFVCCRPGVCGPFAQGRRDARLIVTVADQTGAVIPGATVKVDGQDDGDSSGRLSGGEDVGSGHRGHRRPRARPLRRPGGVPRIRDELRSATFASGPATTSRRSCCRSRSSPTRSRSDGTSRRRPPMRA